VSRGIGMADSCNRRVCLGVCVYRHRHGACHVMPSWCMLCHAVAVACGVISHISSVICLISSAIMSSVSSQVPSCHLSRLICLVPCASVLVTGRKEAKGRCVVRKPSRLWWRQPQPDAHWLLEVHSHCGMLCFLLPHTTVCIVTPSE